MILSLALLLGHFTLSAQTTGQVNLVTRFFNNSGGNMLQDATHPACTWSYADVKAYSGHTYYISMHYRQVLTSNEFVCRYKLRLNYLGQFLSLNIVECKCPDFNCFGICRVTTLDDITTSSNRLRYEKYTGSRLENMSCEEYTNVKLYYQWYDLGYYSAY